MARKLLYLLLPALLLALTAAPSAGAIGLQDQRVVAQPDRVAKASSLIASAAACPGQDGLGAPAAAQEQAMACMIDFARRQAGLGSLASSPALTQSAGEKSSDILSCDSFSHFACGRAFAYWIKETGYTDAPCWRVGENLAWGTGAEGTVGSIFAAWMRSPSHRANLLGDFDEAGISLRIGSLEGEPGTRVWAQHFGSHCG